MRAHWRADATELRRLVPDSLELETFDGSAWLAVTPFRVTAVRLRGTLPVPAISTFIELNVRTYVTAGGKPGVWFFSLDASSRLAVEVGRRAYELPYFHARMSATAATGQINFCQPAQNASRGPSQRAPIWAMSSPPPSQARACKGWFGSNRTPI